MTRSPRPGPVPAVLWPAAIAALAVIDANVGHGAWPRRSAIGWMMGSWGARLAVQSLYTRTSVLPLRTSPFVLLTSALFLSLPALLASRNPDPELSPVEIGAAIVWVVAFAGQTTADRGRLTSVPYGSELCEALIWISFALFASMSEWGWAALACPAVRIYMLTRRCSRRWSLLRRWSGRRAAAAPHSP